MTKVKIHFINIEDGKMISQNIVNRVPAVGDEARFSNFLGEVYYKIVGVVWVYDEPDCPFERVNIGIEKIKDGE